jgi:glycosyltransferase involved in cell wall biosynthesis
VKSEQVNAEQRKTEQRKRNVLIIAYYFPPIGGGGVQRALKMAKYLGEFGWQPHVLTVEPVAHVSLDESLLAELPEGVRIHRCREWSLGRQAFLPAPRPASAAGGGAAGAAAVPSASAAAAAPAAPGETAVKTGTSSSSAQAPRLGTAARLKRRLFPLLKRLKNVLLIPDDQILWLVPAIRLGNAVMQRERIDAVVSTSGPVTNHLVGLALRRRYGKPWIADFRDPWTQNMHRSGIRWREWLEERLERMVLWESDVLLTVTHSFARNFRAKFAEELRRVEVIHNGFDRADYAMLADVDKSEAERDRCVFLYTGIFYKERNPRLFLRAVRELIDEGRLDADRIRLRFAGVFDYPGYSDNADCVRDLRLEAVVDVLGHLPHKQALTAMKQADVLVLVGDTAPGSGDYIPGKLYEYMAIGKPILALSLPGETTRIIETYGLGTVADPLDLAAIKEAVLALYGQWQARNEGADAGDQAASGGPAGPGPATGYGPDKPSVAVYERREQARMLAQLLDELHEAARK